MRVQQFDYSVDLTQSILWQYDKATNLLSLVNSKQDWYDVNQSEFWTDFYNNIFNLLTANNFGLAVWSYILNTPFYVDVEPVSPTKANWGFGPFRKNFNHGNFVKDNVLNLTTEEQRFLLRLIYYKLCNRGAVTGVNEFLNYLISTSDIGYTGTVYMLDGLDMSITYVFTKNDFPDNLYKIIQDLDALPRPTGVKIFYHVHSEFNWGFGAFRRNFNHGNFIKTTS